jgi:hypothetical protein
MELIPENLKAIQRWERPDHYAGADWFEFFVFLGQHRDSDSVTRSNFIEGLKALGGESDTVQVVRERHWGVGWLEWIAIHETDHAAILAADEMLCALSDYPVLDECALSELEWDEAAEYWERMSVRDRVQYLQRADLCIFSARHDYLPADCANLLELLR